MRQTAVTGLWTACTVRAQNPGEACECLGQLFEEMVLNFGWQYSSERALLHRSLRTKKPSRTFSRSPTPSRDSQKYKSSTIRRISCYILTVPRQGICNKLPHLLVRMTASKCGSEERKQVKDSRRKMYGAPLPVPVPGSDASRFLKHQTPGESDCFQGGSRS